MVRRPWHANGGRILDYNNTPLAKIIDESSAETRLMAMAPEIALSYLQIADECDELRSEVERLQDELEEEHQRRSA